MATDAEQAAAARAALAANPGVKSVAVDATGNTTVVYRENADIIAGAQFFEQRASADPANRPVKRVLLSCDGGYTS